MRTTMDWLPRDGIDVVEPRIPIGLDEPGLSGTIAQWDGPDGRVDESRLYDWLTVAAGRDGDGCVQVLKSWHVCSTSIDRHLDVERGGVRRPSVGVASMASFVATRTTQASG